MQTLSIVDRRGADSRLLSTSENEIREARDWRIDIPVLKQIKIPADASTPKCSARRDRARPDLRPYGIPTRLTRGQTKPLGEWGAARQFSPLGSRRINSQVVLKIARLTMRILKAADRSVTVPPEAEFTVNGLDELKDCTASTCLCNKATADPHR